MSGSTFASNHQFFRASASAGRVILSCCETRRCVVTQEFGARHALEAANLLLEEDSDSEAEESNN